MAPEADPVARWVNALEARHAHRFSRPQFLKAVRALSARYVERRAGLDERSPLDSAGKRAAFAVYYAPLHCLTVRAIVSRLGGAARDVESIVDLGCGTGAAAAGWALAASRTRSADAPPGPATAPAMPGVEGIDRDAWTLREAAWTWKTLGLRGRVRRDQMATAVARLARGRRPLSSLGIVAGWSANELPPADRLRLRDALLALHARGASVLILEPLARSAAPWWDEWGETVSRAGGVATEWRLDVDLPGALAVLDRDAGFRREGLTARTFWLPGRR